MEIFVIRDGEQTGPFDEALVKTLLSEGGARPQDLAWRKGLARWLPLSEVLAAQSNGNGEPESASSPAVAHGANGSASGRGLATAKQKAFLKYLGAEFNERVSREKAALAISDALEDPAMQGRIRKWQDERLRLHPDVFQDEIDLRKANRASRYLELVQTEGAEALKDVTKAHVQVLVESLDKRHPNWEADSRSALWDYLFPSIGEHFQQLVQPAYKGRLKSGGTSLSGGKSSGSLAGGTRSLIPPPSAPGTLAAMWRGVLFGVIALGAILGGIHFWQQKQAESKGPTPTAPAAGKSAKTDAATKVSEPAMQPPDAVIPPEPSATEAKLPTPPPDAPEAPKEPAAAPAPPTSLAQEPAPPMAPEKPASAEEKPMSPAPAAPAEPLPAPAVMPPPAAPRTEITLVRGIGVALPNGQVSLPVGTRLRYLAIEGPNVRVAWNNNVFFVPAAATDVGKDLPASPAAAPQPMNPAGSPSPSPTKPEPGKKPSDDL